MAIGSDDVRRLGDELSGDVVHPDDEGWDEVRQAWNLSLIHI